MENKEKKPRTQAFTTSLELGNLPMSKAEYKKLEEANRRLKLKPPPDFLVSRGPKAD